MTDYYYINFYGGEPLLCFGLIEKTVSFLDDLNKKFKKKVRYSITTNGSLLNEEILQFLSRHKFLVELSFDGFAQDIQREKHSFDNIVSKIHKLLNRHSIKLEINSVFTNETIGSLSESMEFITKLEVPNVNFSLSIIKPWEKKSLLKLKSEMSKLRKIVISYYKEKGSIPIKNFTDYLGKGIYYCAAGNDRFAVSADGGIWGCDLFADYFKGKEKSSEYSKFYFGELDAFIKDHEKIYPRIFPNYSRLSMDNFSTPNMKCFLCQKLEDCSICPVNAAFSSGHLGKVPSYVCEIQNIKIDEIRKFKQELKEIKPKLY